MMVGIAPLGATAEVGDSAATSSPAKLAPEAGVSVSPELLALPSAPPKVHPVGTVRASARPLPDAPKGSVGAHLAVDQRGQPSVSSPPLSGGERDLAVVVRLKVPF